MNIKEKETVFYKRQNAKHRHQAALQSLLISLPQIPRERCDASKPETIVWLKQNIAKLNLPVETLNQLGKLLTS
jgi:hypothetical protein